MDWFPIVIALVVIILVRELRLWWLSSTYSLRSGPAIPIPISDDPKAEGAQYLTTSVVARSERVEPENLNTPFQAFPSIQGFFSHAHDLTFYQPVMYNVNETKEKVLQWLAAFTMSGAEFDTRGHPPSCHPGTRITILDALHSRVDDVQRAQRILWLHGPAGVGKSAIMQSLAERLNNSLKLGATLFFSRPNKRDNPAFVLPTIAYQLAVRVPRYKDYVRKMMVEDPKLLEKETGRQFKIFIIEPFTNPSFAKQCGTWAVLLDGLDECYGEDAQVSLVTLICRFSLQYPSAPLIWLIASRPEAHLQHAFSTTGVRGSFEDYNVPANSDDACRDVERFLRAKFEEIRQKYRDLIPVGTLWPVEQDITRVSRASSGLFVFAATVVRYIEDPHVCDPVSQLATVVSVTGGLEPGSLSTLHAFYSAILDGVPKAMLPTLKLLLLLYTVKKTSSILNDNEDTGDGGGDIPLVFVATLSNLQQHDVYSTLRRLLSVIKVPPPEESGYRGIKFYHASFPDYLKTVSADYGCESQQPEAELWRNYFKMLHGGDSSLYQRAISGGCPPIRLSWDSRPPGGFLDSIWEQGMSALIHDLMPECPEPGELGHFQVPLTGPELQGAFEKIDFSALLFQRRHKVLFPDLFDLFDWLTSNAPPELVESGIVEMTPLGDLDLSYIPEDKLAHEFSWTSRERERVGGAEGPRQRQFHRRPIRRETHHYTNAPLKSLHFDWHHKTRPFESLTLKLRKLQSDHSMSTTLVVGRGPSRRCVIICVEPQAKKRGSFYYVPYGQ